MHKKDHLPKDIPVRNSGRGERYARPARDYELQVDIIIFQISKVRDGKYGMELLGKVPGILLSRPETDDRPDVSQHGTPDLGIDLMEVLVGKGERDPELPQLAEHPRNARSGIVLELIEEDMEGLPVTFNGIDSCKGGIGKGGDQDGTYQSRGIGTDLSL